MSSSVTSLSSKICEKCGEVVEQYEAGADFSMKLHMQSHKPLEEINQELEEEEAKARMNSRGTFNSNHFKCIVCKENVEIINHDIGLTLQRHEQKHIIQKSQEILDQSSTSSNVSKSSDKGVAAKTKSIPPVVQDNILSSIFNSLPVGLKKHWGFIFESKIGKVFCDVCNIELGSVFYIPEHLKTKLHEDNIILLVKLNLPENVHHSLEFVSFYGSDLCCNLCRCNIDLRSNNVHATIVNILAHNASESHLKKKTSSEIHNSHDNSVRILEALALINPVIKENKDYIDCKMQPQFKCKSCDNIIPNNENENKLLDNFISHFNSVSHNKSVTATSVLRSLKEGYLTQEGSNNFTLSNSNVFCKICNCTIEPAIDMLVAHVRERRCTAFKMKEMTCPPDLVSELSRLSLNLHEVVSINSLPSTSTAQSSISNYTIPIPPAQTITQVPSSIPEPITDLKHLLVTLPVQFRNVKYLTLTGPNEVKCLICNRVIPASTYNLRTHLLGKSHKIEEEKSRNNNIINRKSQLKQGFQVVNSSRKSYDEIHKLLQSTDQFIASNSKFFQKIKNGTYYCIVCMIPIQQSLNIDELKKNICSHINSREHQKKCHVQKLLKSSIPGNQSQKVKNLFKILEHSLQENIEYISDPNDESNDVFCVVCNIKISMHFRCVQEHVKGYNHREALKIFCMLNKTKIDQLQFNDKVLQTIINSDPTLRNNGKFLRKKGDDYCCILCESVIKNSFSEELLKQNILSHFKGQKHVKNYKKTIDFIYERLLLTCPVIKMNQDCLQNVGIHYYCRNCNCTITGSDDEVTVKQNLLIHLQGNQHMKKNESVFPKVFSTNPPANSNLRPTKPIVDICNTDISVNLFETSLSPNISANSNLGSTKPFEDICNTGIDFFETSLSANPSANLNLRSTEPIEDICKTDIDLFETSLSANSSHNSNMKYTKSIEDVCNMDINISETSLSANPSANLNFRSTEPIEDICNTGIDFFETSLSANPSYNSNMKCTESVEDICNIDINLSETSLSANPSANLNFRSTEQIQDIRNSDFDLIETSISANSNLKTTKAIKDICNTDVDIFETSFSANSSANSSLRSTKPFEHLLKMSPSTHPSSSPTMSSKKSVEDLFKTFPRYLQRDLFYIQRREEGYLFCTLCSYTVHFYNLREHLEKYEHIYRKSDEPIKCLFERIPEHLQDNMSYIKNGPVEGYLFCKLCDTVIDPTYLREHLEEERHSLKRSSFEKPNIEPKIQNLLKNVTSLSSLLGNIDNKLNWSLKQ